VCVRACAYETHNGFSSNQIALFLIEPNFHDSQYVTTGLLKVDCLC
jgi:hypothetical protein